MFFLNLKLNDKNLEKFYTFLFIILISINFFISFMSFFINFFFIKILVFFILFFEIFLIIYYYMKTNNDILNFFILISPFFFIIFLFINIFFDLKYRDSFDRKKDYFFLRNEVYYNFTSECKNNIKLMPGFREVNINNLILK